MYQFTGRLKTISIVLMIIGAISIGFSFLAGGGDHHEDSHGEHAEATLHEENAHGGAEHGHADAHHSTHSEKPDYVADPEPDYDDQHKTAQRALDRNQKKYVYVDGVHDAEHIHHQQQNIPWANLLTNNFFFLAVGLGALFFLAIQYAAQVGWSVTVLRVIEAVAQFVWIPLVIMLVLILTGVFHVGGNHLWHWMAEGIMDPASDNYDSIIAGKEGYLNGPFFTLRTVIYLLGWGGAAYMFRKMSKRFDSGSIDPNTNWKKMRNFAAGFLVFFAVTSSTSAWDWIMSIDTHWFSTLFGWYVFAGIFVSALTTITLITLYLKKQGLLEDVNQSHIHDLGKFMFAFSIFWTYLWFSQFMLIWYSDMPEEVTYYMARFGEYQSVFFTMVAMNFLFPILILLSRDTKRNYGFLIAAGIFIIIGHWLDVYIMIHPGSVGGEWTINWMHIGTFLGYLGLFIFVVFTAISKVPLLLKNHPMYGESKHFHI